MEEEVPPQHEGAGAAAAAAAAAAAIVPVTNDWPAVWASLKDTQLAPVPSAGGQPTGVPQSPSLLNDAEAREVLGLLDDDEDHAACDGQLGAAMPGPGPRALMYQGQRVTCALMTLDRPTIVEQLKPALMAAAGSGEPSTDRLVLGGLYSVFRVVCIFVFWDEGEDDLIARLGYNLSEALFSVLSCEDDCKEETSLPPGASVVAIAASGIADELVAQLAATLQVHHDNQPGLGIKRRRGPDWLERMNTVLVMLELLLSALSCSVRPDSFRRLTKLDMSSTRTGGLEAALVQIVWYAGTMIEPVQLYAQHLLLLLAVGPP